MEDLLISNFKGVDHRIVINGLLQAPLADVFHKLSSYLGIVEETMKVILPGGKLLKASTAGEDQTTMQAGEKLRTFTQSYMHLPLTCQLSILILSPLETVANGCHERQPQILKPPQRCVWASSQTTGKLRSKLCVWWERRGGA